MIKDPERVLCRLTDEIMIKNPVKRECASVG